MNISTIWTKSNKKGPRKFFFAWRFALNRAATIHLPLTVVSRQNILVQSVMGLTSFDKQRFFLRKYWTKTSSALVRKKKEKDEEGDKQNWTKTLGQVI